MVDPIVQEIMVSPEFSFIYYLIPKSLHPLFQSPTSPQQLVKAKVLNVLDKTKMDLIKEVKQRKRQRQNQIAFNVYASSLAWSQPRTKDNRSKCFDFNMSHGCPNKDGQCQKGDHSCMSWSCGDAKHSYQTCHAKNKKPSQGSSA